MFLVDGPANFAIRLTEIGTGARRGIPQMILGQVFEKFPNLKYAITEQMGTWIFDTLEMIDSAYFCDQMDREADYIRDVLPRRPSEYFRDNLLVGASFMFAAGV